MPNPTLPPFVYSPSWPRFRRLARTGPYNPNYVRGHYTRRRRHRIEAPLIQAMRTLHPAAVLRVLPRLPVAAREQANEILGWLTGDCHPDKWALRDLRPGKSPSWYVPRVAWAFAAAWLRQARVVARLFTFAVSVISSPMPPLLKRGIGGQQPDRKRSARDEVERLRAWSRAHGLSWEGPAPTT